MLLKKAHKKKSTGFALEMSVQGSKHSFSRVFPSFLQLDNGVLRNVPNIKDVQIQIEIMKRLGFDLDFDEESNTLRYSGSGNQGADFLNIGDYSSKYSRSLINLYPIFSRFNIELQEPRGCPIGRRDISWYVDIMRHFGIRVDLENNRTRVFRGSLKGVEDIQIRDRSFSSTNIAITCAIEAKSATKIIGPSIEPEIFDLVTMLQKASVNIIYDHNQDIIHIRPDETNQIKSVDHTILPDRNVMVTLICGALLLKKDIRIKTYGFTEEQLQLAPLTDVLKQINLEYEFIGEDMIVKGSTCKFKGKQIDIKAGHYPLFCSDWQPLIAVLAASGLKMTIEDTLFESRFGYLHEYGKFGLKYKLLDDRRAEIYDSEGFETDSDQTLQATARDLRCGAGVGLLSMLHEGRCKIDNVVQIKRGYERFDRQLNALMGEDIYSFEEDIIS